MTFKYWETCAAKEGLRSVEGNEPVTKTSVVTEEAAAEPFDMTIPTAVEVTDHEDVSIPLDETGNNSVLESEADIFASETIIHDVAVTEPDDEHAPEEETDPPVFEPDTPDDAVSEPDIPEDAVSETEIVDLQEIRRDREDTARFNREVEEFFEEEERKATGQDVKKKSLARKIFVDGLLGIPLLIVTYIVAAAFLVLFALITAVFFVAGLAVLIAAVIVITNSFRIFSVNVPTAMVCIGASVAAIGLGLMLFILCLLTAKYVLPFIIRLPIAFEKKLRLFKN